MSLSGAEFELSNQEKREYFLKNQLDKIPYGTFDYVIIDCPPSLGALTINALCASKHLIIPTQCEYYALEGLTQLMMSVKTIKRLCNPRLIITGILITMYNQRYKLSSQVMAELEKYYGSLLFDTKIARSISLSEAPSFGEPIFYYSRYSKGSLQYTQLAKEIISRVEGIF
jgi:chromosome partitioning protein